MVALRTAIGKLWLVKMPRPVAGLLLSANMNAKDSACDDPAYREFDFWLGSWQVHRPDGSLAGHNRIERRAGTGYLHEHYTSVTGFSGESLNTYDASRKLWHQSWVDNTGMLLLLEGHLVDGNMVLEGQTLDDKGVATRQRITWTPSADGSVRQFWESTDAAGAWSTAFEGRYTRE